MMGVMDLGLLEREAESRPLTGWAPGSPAPAILNDEAQPLFSGGGYTPERRRGMVLAIILAVHIVAIGALATARYQANRADQRERVTSFSIQEPPPPPPMEPLPAEPQVQAEAAPVVAPVTAIELPSLAEIPAVRPEAVKPVIASPAVTVNVQPAPAPARPSAPAPVSAPITPPDFSAAQLRNPGPAYPFLSRRAREEGVVLLKVLVSVEGRAAQLHVEQSSGFARLDKAALETVAKWRFVPASQAGQPREAWVLVPVTFSLG